LLPAMAKTAPPLNQKFIRAEVGQRLAWILG
jgi:hypothetical protein